MNWRKNETGTKVFVEYLKAVNVVGNSRHVAPKAQQATTSHDRSQEARRMMSDWYQERCNPIDSSISIGEDIPSYIKS